MPRIPTNREILTKGDTVYARKKLNKHGVDEVKFDPEARKEFLTGFHKRKLERKEKAKERQKEMERQERILERQRIREERKEMMEKNISQFNEAMKGIAVTGDDEDEENEEVPNKSGSESDFSDWDGMEDGAESRPKGVLKQKYTGDDGEVTAVVTIEEMDTNTSILAPEDSKEVLENSVKRAQDYAKHVQKVEQKKHIKQKKKKFRYLSPLERKSNVSKERNRNKEKRTRAKDKK